jgi:hypothetical protein
VQVQRSNLLSKWRRINCETLCLECRRLLRKKAFLATTLKDA